MGMSFKQYCVVAQSGSAQFAFSVVKYTYCLTYEVFDHEKHCISMMVYLGLKNE